MPTLDYIDRERKTMNEVNVIKQKAQKISGVELILKGDVSGRNTFDGTDSLTVDTKVSKIETSDLERLLK